MKIQVAKRDLEAALEVVVNSMTSSGTDISSHFVFRADADENVEVLTFTGRLFSQAPVKCVVELADLGEYPESMPAFTVEGARLLAWVRATKEAALTLEYGPDTKVVTARSPRGAMEFQSTDPTNFPFWDDMWSDVDEKGKIPADKLAAGLSYAKRFCFEKETQHPELCLIECSGGMLYATDEKAIALVEVDGLQNSTLRIHRNDAAAVLKFLGTCGEEEVTLMEHARSLLFKRGDGAVFGETRFKAKYPSITVARDNPDPIWWRISVAEIKESIPYLRSGAAKEDSRIFLSRSGDGPVKLGMKAMTGAQMNIDLNVIESGSEDGAALPPAGFTLDHHDLMKVISSWQADVVKLGIHVHAQDATKGYVRFREERDEVDYLSICAWLS